MYTDFVPEMALAMLRAERYEITSVELTPDKRSFVATVTRPNGSIVQALGNSQGDAVRKATREALRP